MIIVDNFRSAISALLSNKLRAFLTMLGIVIGVSAVIALLSIGQGVEKYINNQFNALGTHLLFVQSKLGSSQAAQYLANQNYQTSLTQNDAKALADPLQVQDTAGSEAIIRVDAVVRYANSKLVSTVRGATPNYAAARNLQIDIGRFINEDDVSAQARVAVIGKTVLDQLFPTDLTPIDRYIK